MILSSALCVLALLQPIALAQDVVVSPTEIKEWITRVRSSTDETLHAQTLELGRTLIRTNRFNDAAALLNVLVEKRPHDYAALYFAALATFNSGRPQDAEPLARRAVEVASSGHSNAVRGRNEDAADSLVLLAVVLAVRNNNNEALKAAEQAVRLAPDNFDAQFVLGRALFGASDYDASVKAFRHAAALKPSDSDAQFFLATALERVGDDAAALSAYRQLTINNPRSFEGHLGLGVLLVKKGGAALEEGLNELRTAIEINQRLYEAHVTLGRTLVSMGRPAEALKHLKVAADLAPNNPEPHYQLSLAYRRLGWKEEAARESAIVKQIHESRRRMPPLKIPGSSNY